MPVSQNKKKIATFIGNCHNTGLIYYLQKSKEFDDTYKVLRHANWQLIKTKAAIPVQNVEVADLFVYQPLDAVHGCYSTDPRVEGSIGSLVRDDCIKIAYPYTYNSALWPIIQAAKGENRWFGNEVIDDLRTKYEDYEIVRLYDRDKIDWKYKKRYADTMHTLMAKEELTDVIASDFIDLNIKSKELFLIPQHPSSIFFLELANRVLDKLGFKRLDESIVMNINEPFLEDSTYGFPSGKFPVHSSALDYYKFDYVQKPDECAKDFYRQLLRIYMNHNPRRK